MRISDSQHPKVLLEMDEWFDQQNNIHRHDSTIIIFKIMFYYKNSVNLIPQDNDTVLKY